LAKVKDDGVMTYKGKNRVLEVKQSPPLWVEVIQLLQQCNSSNNPLHFVDIVDKKRTSPQVKFHLNTVEVSQRTGGTAEVSSQSLLRGKLKPKKSNINNIVSSNGGKKWADVSVSSLPLAAPRSEEIVRDSDDFGDDWVRPLWVAPQSEAQSYPGRVAPGRIKVQHLSQKQRKRTGTWLCWLVGMHCIHLVCHWHTISTLSIR